MIHRGFIIKDSYLNLLFIIPLSHQGWIETHNIYRIQTIRCHQYLKNLKNCHLESSDLSFLQICYLFGSLFVKMISSDKLTYDLMILEWEQFPSVFLQYSSYYVKICHNIVEQSKISSISNHYHKRCAITVGI